MAQTTAKKPRSKRSGPPTLRSFNPRTGEVIREIPTIAPGEVADVVAQARKVAPEWAAIPVEGRIRMLKEVRHRLYDMMDEIVETVAAECGKPRSEALAHDVLPAVMLFTSLEKAATKALKDQRVGGITALLSGVTSTIQWRPFGVVGCITPWNYPITNCFLAVAPPLFAGNAVVVKPSEVTPASGELVAKLLEPLPSGVATVIQGGGDVGAALVDAPCDKISFIGSPPTGRRICEAAAKHLTPVVMELGGKDAAIVCEDADIDVTSSGIAWGSFFNAGQTCCSIERVYVHKAVADEFRTALLDKLQQVRQGDDVGTLTFAKQLDIVRAQVDDAVKKGAKVLAGGPDAGIQNENGTLWFSPTVIEEADGEMKILQEETFGPAIVLTTVNDDDEAVRRANEEAPNLTASVWTSDKARSRRLAEQIRAGGVGSNLHGTLPAFSWGPWGGVGESGYGRLNGVLGIQEFAVPTHIAHNLNPKMKQLWWFPYDDASRESLTGMIKVFGAKNLSDKIAGVRDIAGSIGSALKNKL